ncbi:hypothetical protein Q8F55_008614 [Vanrija albida]|uniref:PHD-type domain-containing protein n=1 Tax=Vanrija albida TaxID=181172 RepID=A0ABR3PRC5_9TREE
MNGGVIFESNAHTQLHPAPVLKQELITEHYAITAKRPSNKDRMSRPAKVSTTYAADPQQQQPLSSPYMSAPTHAQFPPGYPGGLAPGPGPFYQQPPPDQFYAYQQQQPPVPGPSRRLSNPAEFQPAQPSMYQGEPAASAYNPTAPTWETASSSSHKRKRSNSSQREEIRTPRKDSQSSLPDVNDGRPAAQRSGNAPGQSQLPTPPSTGGNLSTPVMATRALLDERPLARIDEREAAHGVFVTATEDEGRKLGLVQNSNGTEAVEAAPARGPPRTTTTTVLSVNSATGAASVGRDNVLQSELAWVHTTPAAPGRKPPPPPRTPEPRTPNSETRALPNEDADTPGTKETKIKKRLSAFKSTVSPGAEPMFSIRLDMGQGHLSRVALRKDMALAFIGYDKTTQVVEESRSKDDDGWAALAKAPSGSRPVRPEWPDDEAPWKIGSGNKRARQLRDEKERTTLLRRYFESSSDDEEEEKAEASPAHRANGDSKSIIRVRRLPVPVVPGPASGPDEWEINPSDARTALVNTLRRGRRSAAVQAAAHAAQNATMPTIPGGVVACVCKQTTPANGSMISCASCKTWHHLACVGLEEVQIAPNWVCEPCVIQARRATFSTPRGSANRFTSTERSASAFRGDQALALAPSPMFAGEAVRAATSTAGSVPGTRTPFSPTRSHQRARVLSYGNDLWGVSNEEGPSTPVPAARLPDRFSTPRADEPAFDVNSTPSRHLSTDPRMAGQFNSLFSMTPLMGRSRNTTSMLVGGDTPTPMPMGGRGRNASGLPPFSEGVKGRHEFLQGLTADRRPPHTDGPASPLRRPGGGLLNPPPVSPSPYGGIGHGHRRTLSGTLSGPKFGQSQMRSSSRSGLGLGMVTDRDEEEDDDWCEL